MRKIIAVVAVLVAAAAAPAAQAVWVAKSWLSTLPNACRWLLVVAVSAGLAATPLRRAVSRRIVWRWRPSMMRRAAGAGRIPRTGRRRRHWVNGTGED